MGKLVRATRPEGTPVEAVRDFVEWGAGPRAGQALILSAKARALLDGRFATTLEDLRAMARPAMRHRVLINFRGQAERVSADDVVSSVIEQLAEPSSPLDRA